MVNECIHDIKQWNGFTVHTHMSCRSQMRSLHTNLYTVLVSQLTVLSAISPHNWCWCEQQHCQLLGGHTMLSPTPLHSHQFYTPTHTGSWVCEIATGYGDIAILCIECGFHKSNFMIFKFTNQLILNHNILWDAHPTEWAMPKPLLKLLCRWISLVKITNRTITTDTP